MAGYVSMNMYVLVFVSLYEMKTSMNRFVMHYALYVQKRKRLIRFRIDDGGIYNQRVNETKEQKNKINDHHVGPMKQQGYATIANKSNLSVP